MIDAFIGLGSNLATPLQQLEACVARLRSVSGISVVAVSPFYGSTAIGPGEQPDYVNGAAHLQTTLTPMALLQALQAIEHQQGRERGPVRWLPRTLDIDILLYGNTQVNEPHLSIPHPRMQERNFVLLPLFDLAPDLVLPDGNALRDLVQRCGSTGLWRLNASNH